MQNFMSRGFANITLIVVLVVAIAGGGWWYLNKSNTPATSGATEFPTRQQSTNSETQPIVNNQLTQTNAPPKTTSTQPSGAASVWQTYRSSYGFEIQYPPAWKIVSEAGDGKAGYPGWVVSFGTGTFGNQGYDGELFVFAYEKSSTNVEQYIKDMGKQFSDRQEKRGNITINGISAVKVVVTTPSVPTWDYEAVIIEQQNRFYVMHNGAVKRDSFTDFYKSFKLIPNSVVLPNQLPASKTSGPAPLEVRFSTAGAIPAGEEVESFNIDFGDSQTERGASFFCFESQCIIDHTYVSPGTYMAELYKPGPVASTPRSGALIYGTVTIVGTQ